MSITGEKWCISTHRQIALVGFLAGVLLTMIWLTILVIGATLSGQHMIPLLEKVKRQSLYGFWFGLVFFSICILTYFDARIFSGVNTTIWEYVGRIGAIVTIAINVSVVFWILWFATEPGTPGFEFLYDSPLWKWAVNRIREITFIAASWYISIILRVEFGFRKSRVYGALAMILIFGIGIPWILVNTTHGVRLRTTSLFEALAAFLALAIATIRGIKSEEKPNISSNNDGILRRLLLQYNFSTLFTWFAIGLTTSFGAILFQFPISGDNPLLDILYYTTLITPILLVIFLRTLRR